MLYCTANTSPPNLKLALRVGGSAVMYSSRHRWAIVNEDRHCGASHGQSKYLVQPMVPHVQHAGCCGNLRGICGTLRDHCWNMLEFAGPCWTMLDHLRGTRGMIGRSRMTDRHTIRKSGLLLVEIGVRCPPLPLLPGCRVGRT
jgi:hypothetical protein